MTHEYLSDIAHRALKHAETASNMTYRDARVETHNIITVQIENGKVDHIKNTTDSGIGIRILDTINDVWQFTSISNPRSWNNVKNALDDIVKNKDVSYKIHNLSNSNSKNQHNKINMYETKQHTAKIKYPVRKIPDQDSIIKIGIECSKNISSIRRITNSAISVQYHTVSKHYTNNQGSDITQNYTDTIMHMTATATANGTTRSIDTTIGGRGGLEILFDQKVAETKALHIGDTASKVAAEGRAIKHVKREAQVVMDPSFVALLVHEIMGHPSEADRIMGREMAWAGGSWWRNMRGKKIASDVLNVFDDPTIPSTLGHYQYDDEGVKSANTQLIKDGTLHKHLQSRETAAHEFYDEDAKPTSNMRATSYEFAPLIRMACTCIKPGNYNTDEMISSIKDGYIIYGMKVPSIDMYRYNWSISCQYAQHVVNGEPAEIQRDVIVSGTAPEFLKSISACGKDFAITPITNCGKGDPMQSLAMGNGGPSILAKATVSSI